MKYISTRVLAMTVLCLLFLMPVCTHACDMQPAGAQEIIARGIRPNVLVGYFNSAIKEIATRAPYLYTSNNALMAENQQLRHENAQLKADNERLEGEKTLLQMVVHASLANNKGLQTKLEALQQKKAA